MARDIFTEKLLEQLPKNVSEIEFKEDHKNFKITKVDEPDSDNEDENDESNVGGSDTAGKKSIDSVKQEDYVIVTSENSDVIDLISDDEEEEYQTSNNKRTRVS